MLDMFEIADNQIIYTLPDKDSLEPINPFLFVERLTDEITITWPHLHIKTVFARRRNFNHKICCSLPSNFDHHQVRLITGTAKIRVYAVLGINTFMPSTGLCRVKL